MDAVTKRELRQLLSDELEKHSRDTSSSYRSTTVPSTRVLDNLVDDIERLLNRRGYQVLPPNKFIGNESFINVDALGADRKAREI